MFKSLSPGAIGVGGTTEEIAALAARHGFGGIDFDAAEAADRMAAGELDSLRAIYERHGLRPGAMGLPVQFRGDEEAFQRDLAGLSRQAEAAAAMGCDRCATWILPASDELGFEENFERHRRRLKACAEVLGEHGLRLGLEFVGPKTSRAGKKHEFLYDMKGMLSLTEAIGTGNVGLLLDCWHWYCTSGTAEEILALRQEQVVHVHVNDAPAGLAVDEQVDNRRAMPGETGVIDIVAFLGSLARIGYAGPVMAEPFSEALRELPAEEAVRATSESLDRIFAAAGLTPA
jgi:sugar phosphate isomerase/epimerase